MPDKVEPHVTLWNLEKSEKGLFIECVHLREMFVYHGQCQDNVCFINTAATIRGKIEMIFPQGIFF